MRESPQRSVRNPAEARGRISHGIFKQTEMDTNYTKPHEVEFSQEDAEETEGGNGIKV